MTKLIHAKSAYLCTCTCLKMTEEFNDLLMLIALTWKKLTYKSTPEEWSEANSYYGRSQIDEPVWQEWCYSQEYNVPHHVTLVFGCLEPLGEKREGRECEGEGRKRGGRGERVWGRTKKLLGGMVSHNVLFSNGMRGWHAHVYMYMYIAWYISLRSRPTKTVHAACPLCAHVGRRKARNQGLHDMSFDPNLQSPYCLAKWYINNDCVVVHTTVAFHVFLALPDLVKCSHMHLYNMQLYMYMYMYILSMFANQGLMINVTPVASTDAVYQENSVWLVPVPPWLTADSRT